MNRFQFFSLAVATTAAIGLFQTAAISTPTPCRVLGRSDTVVIIGAGTADRVGAINTVVQQNSLQGDFCQNKAGKTVWMSQQFSVKAESKRVFGLFKAAGLIKPVRLGGNR